MAKDKTRKRNLPEWLKQRVTVMVPLTAAMRAYYGLQAVQGKLLPWHDCQVGNWRQGAKVRP